MDAVLNGKLDSMAYLPLDFIITRIQGAATYSIEDLKKITTYNQQSYKDEAQADKELEEQKAIFWEAVDTFDEEEKIKFMIFVRALNRLPASLDGLNFRYHLNAPTKDRNDETKITAWHENGLPKSHTCTFQLDSPYYTSAKILKEQLVTAWSCAQAGVED